MKRVLIHSEIEQLEKQGCRASNWEQILVHEHFNANHIWHTTFSGNVEIGKDVSLDRVGIIENYILEDRVTIRRVNELTTNKVWLNEFYQGGVTVGNEAGDINIHFKPNHIEQLDWLEAHYPQIAKQAHFTSEEKLSCNRIGEGSTLCNVGVIRNVLIGKGVTIDGAVHLECGQLHEDCHIGTQVIAHHFSIGARTKVTDGAKLYHVITSNDCKIGKGFMAENCYFGHHCEMFCGEGCAVFAGPHTVSHHKSTLLIGGEFSFYNAGSNTNQSNHAYKLGPVHHGTLARGSKTASGCHILWPMQTAPFTMVMGKVKTHPDLTALPFSYIIADGEKVFAAPGMNLGTAGTFRDVMKWIERGNSPYTGEYEFLSPIVMQSVFKGMEVLTTLQETYGTEVEEYPYHGTFIRKSALQKGLLRYQLAIRMYANKITPTDDIHTEARNWHWIDVAGLPMIEEHLAQEFGHLTTGGDKAQAVEKLNTLYTTQAQQWGAAMLHHLYGDSFTSGKMKQESTQALEEWKTLLATDAHKELTLGDMNEEIVNSFLQKLGKETFIR